MTMIDIDFSSLNPITSNALNLAARNNDVKTVRRLLKKMNPNCIDHRGWTCLHEAAHSDSYESLLLILKHPDCRPLCETHEGHTALYLACRNRRSLKSIKALLELVDDIVNYGSTECVTPLHIAASQGRVELMDLFFEYGAIIDVQDFNGDTPLHDAALNMQHKAVAVLLHAGADPEIKNMPGCLTAFHLACFKGCLQTVKNLFPFITDINHVSASGHSALMIALQGLNDEIIHFLLENGADPHIKNTFGELALDMALTQGFTSAFDTLLVVTDKDKINKNIILTACKPNYFKFEILEALLNSDLGPEFFNFIEPIDVSVEQIGDRKPCYSHNAPLNSYLNICEYIYELSPDKFKQFFYLFLMRGVQVNAADINECPPLVYMHFGIHDHCFKEVFEILIEHGCNVDYCSSLTSLDKDKCVPDAFHVALIADASTIPIMMPYSVHCDPDTLLLFAYDHDVVERIPQDVQDQLLCMIFNNCENVTSWYHQYYVPPLLHLCRYTVRTALWKKMGTEKTTQKFLEYLNNLPIPHLMKRYLRYL